MLDTELCVLHFLRGNERVAHTAAQLCKYGIIHRLVLVAKQDRAKSHVIINVLVAVRIPDMPVLAVVNINRRHTLDMRLRAFTV